MSEAQHHRLALPQGTRIRDFEFHRVLGYGGFGITYLGWNLALDIPVAIKEYLPADLATREQDGSVVPQTSQAASDFQWGLERFLDEARILARFQHPNIVRVHHFFETHSTAYIAMDYVEGETLAAHLERKGPLQEAELTGILYPLLSALEVVHRADFLHRDIKPGNIVLRDVDGSAVLLDFGAARQAIGANSRSVTSIVTPGYAPIEQYSSRGRQGAWTDIYALGGVCYRALTGDVPEDATDRVRHDPLVPVAQRCAGRANAAFLSAVDWALSVDEGDRPQSVGAWREAMVATAGQQAHRQDEERHGTGDEIADAPTQAASRVKDAKHLNRWFKLHNITVFCGVLYLLALALDPSVIFQTQGLMQILSPSIQASFKLGVTGTVPIFSYKFWWTPITAIYLHGGLLHIFFNMMWVRQLGPVVEEIFGPFRLFAIFTVAGIAGFLASTLAGHELTLGTGGSVAGILAAPIAYGRRARAQLSTWQFRLWALLFVMSFVIPGGDNWAHGGGFVGGYAAAYIFSRNSEREGLGAYLAGGLCLLATVGAFVLQFVAVFL